MNMKPNKIILAVSSACVVFLFSVSGIQAQGVADGTINYESADPRISSLAELQAELDAAKPFPTPMVEMPANGISSVAYERSYEAETALPGFAPGWVPGSGPMPDPTVGYTINEGHSLYEMATGDVSPTPKHGSVPTNPLSGPYPPYQRWTWFGRYTS